MLNGPKVAKRTKSLTPREQSAAVSAASKRSADLGDTVRAREGDEKTVARWSLTSEQAIKSREQGRSAIDFAELMTKPVLTIREVMTAGQMSRSHIYTMIAAGALVTRKIGRKTVVLQDDFKAFLAALPAACARRPRASA